MTKTQPKGGLRSPDIAQNEPQEAPGVMSTICLPRRHHLLDPKGPQDGPEVLSILGPTDVMAAFIGTFFLRPLQ